ncbi:hypothetical protein A4A49_09625 [Nicotiana attenuata]|uniref:Uncharacterized protein n=1 Tax=Nicotiana attenuata TaxID=49451 RepID=A0A1J6IQ18_NICAT|nr:hypothetical protein A4A49_09625 [Nicotiana attenuata]
MFSLLSVVSGDSLGMFCGNFSNFSVATCSDTNVFRDDCLCNYFGHHGKLWRNLSFQGDTSRHRYWC